MRKDPPIASIGHAGREANYIRLAQREKKRDEPATMEHIGSAVAGLMQLRKTRQDVMCVE